MKRQETGALFVEFPLYDRRQGEMFRETRQTIVADGDINNFLKTHNLRLRHEVGLSVNEIRALAGVVKVWDLDARHPKDFEAYKFGFIFD